MSEGYTTAAKMAAELLGDPGVEDEINAGSPAPGR